MRPDTLRVALLRDTLESAVDSLHHRRASEIPDDFIADFVSMDWLRWHGGSLRLTATGDKVCRQIRDHANEGVAAPALTVAS